MTPLGTAVETLGADAVRRGVALPLRLSGNLSEMCTVYAGPTAGGPWQVVVELVTGPDSIARNVSPDISIEFAATLVHGMLLGLLSHEIIEQLDGPTGSVWEPHRADDSAVMMPPGWSDRATSVHDWMAE